MTGAKAVQRQVVLSLGSNMGDRLASLQLGVDMLVAGGLVRPAVSSVYETVPVGGPAQDDYLNAVLVAVTAMSARDVLGLAVAAETVAGRVRTVRFGPRTRADAPASAGPRARFRAGALAGTG